MRLTPTTRAFLLGAAVGVSAALIVGFVDLWIHPEQRGADRAAANRFALADHADARVTGQRLVRWV